MAAKKNLGKNEKNGLQGLKKKVLHVSEEKKLEFAKEKR